MTPARRPSLGPPPPEGGAALAVRTAVRRRRARRWAAAGTTSLAALAVGAVVAVGGGGTAALDTEPRDLDSATEPTSTPEPTTSATPAPGPTTSAEATPAPDPTPSDADPGAGPDDPGQGEESDPQPTTAADPSYRTPDMQRTVRPGRTDIRPSACQGVAADESGNVGGYNGWCASAVVVATSSGHSLALQVCRDDSGDGRLVFPGEHEAELVVRRGTAEVWRWSRDHVDDGVGHVLDVARRECVTWTVDWTDVDAGGRRLTGGTYELLATSRAQEVRAVDTAAQFTIDN